MELEYFTSASAASLQPGWGAPHGDAQNISPRKADFRPPRVLIVDDEALLRWSLVETFGTAGYEVLEAASTRTALLALKDPDHPVDAVLLDLKLPDGNGLDVLQQARRRGVTCPVLIMTAYGSADALQRARSLGAAAVISKPFDLDHVLAEVKRFCPLPT